MRFLDRIFQMEEMNGADRCPIYLRRWILLGRKSKSYAIYLHHFLGDDWSLDMHDHPKRFISIGLWGKYVEWTPVDVQSTFFGGRLKFSYPEVYRAPWIRSFPATHIHRITLINSKPCWTLVIVLKVVRDWGWWHDGQWIQWEKYVYGSAKHIADRMKSC